MTDVEIDLVVNCFERTYARVLAPGFFAEIERQNARRFTCRTVLVNNVADPARARGIAEEAVARGDVNRVVSVADRLDAALQTTGLTRADLGDAPYFADWALVAVTLDGPSWMLQWDADARLREPRDWVTPATELMERDARVLVANPNWEDPTLEAQTTEHDGQFALGLGFSDQVFLARRADLARPIYHQRCIARWRFPYPRSFEARVEAHMRHAGRRRATYRDAVYEHPVAMGTSWPHRGLGERATAALRHFTIGALRRSPWRPPHLHGL